MDENTQSTTGMTASEFFAKQGEDLHIRLLTFYTMYTNEKERIKQLDDDILFFEFPEGRYSITYEDLKKEADKETPSSVCWHIELSYWFYYSVAVAIWCGIFFTAS